MKNSLKSSIALLTLLFALRAAGGEQLAVGDIAALVQVGQSVEKILDAILRSGTRFQATPAQIAELSQRGVPLAVVLAIQGQPLSIEGVRRLASTSLAPAAWTKLAALLGVQRATLTPDDAFALHGRVPEGVLALFLEGRAPTGGGAPSRPDPPVPGPAQGTTPAVSSPAPTQQPGVYAHPGKRFVVRFPNGWQVVRAINRSQAVYYFTPEAGQTDPRQLKVAVSVSLIPVPDASALEGLDAVGVLRYFLPVVRTAEPGLVPAGEVAKAKLGALEAGTVTLQGTLKDRPGDFVQEAFAAESEGVIYLVGAQAPKEQFAELRPTLLKVIQDSEFGRPRASRGEKSLEARQIAEKYKGSVVSIVARSAKESATGSGFIIRKDGYLLTNWHVIWNAKASKPRETFFVEWDDALARKKVPAQLIAYRRKASSFSFNWGVDIALMRIPAGDYEPLPLTALSDVGAGDPIVTLGFPSRSLLEGVSLTVSTGVVTRFNRGPDGKVESILTDAVFTHGSSGGPCVSLVTGGVVGLNTYVKDISTGAAQSHVNDLVNYHGVVPIDACLTEFPLITDLGIRLDGTPLDFFDSYALAGSLLARHSTHDAGRLAARAVSLNPQSADAHYMLALCKSQAVGATHTTDAAQTSHQEAIGEYQKALACDPAHENALVMLARLQAQLGQAAEAAQLADRAVQAHPESWQPYLVRAEICFAQKQYAESLQFLARAKAMSSGALPEPYLLAGKANYALNNLDAGRKEYAEAARIHPSSLPARLGMAQYHELRRDTDAAIAEYTAILEDFRDNPAVLVRIATCYYTAGQYAKALPAGVAALRRCAKLRQAAPESLYLQVAKMEIDNKNETSALNAYAAYLSFYKKGDAADQVHVRLADLHSRKQRPGVATAHLREAKALRNSQEVAQMLQRVPPTRLSLAEIKQLAALDYPQSVAYDLIAGSQLDFAVRTDDDAARLSKQDNLPPNFVQAILVAQKRQSGTGPVATPPTVTHPPNPVVNPPIVSPPIVVPPVVIQIPANPIVGTWTTQGQANDGGTWQYTLQFMSNGRYTSTNTANGRVTETLQGSFRADGQTLSGRSDAGRTFTYSYRIQGTTLTVSIPEQGGTFQFTRQ